MGQSWEVQTSSLHSSIHSSHLQELSLQKDHHWVSSQKLGIIWTPFSCPFARSWHYVNPTYGTTFESIPSNHLYFPQSRQRHLLPGPLQKPPNSSLPQAALHILARTVFLNVSVTIFCFKKRNPTPAVQNKEESFKSYNGKSQGHKNRKAMGFLGKGTRKSQDRCHSL